MEENPGKSLRDHRQVLKIQSPVDPERGTPTFISEIEIMRVNPGKPLCDHRQVRQPTVDTERGHHHLPLQKKALCYRRRVLCRPLEEYI